jgi:hypothetical protein
MLRKWLWLCAVVVLLVAPCVTRAQESYLDVYTVKVKADKTVDFTSLSKKWVEANRANGGDRWVTLESVYGEADQYVFISTRSSYADIDKANESTMAAAAKAFGPDMGKLMQDFESTLVSSRADLRRRRWDLSRKAPADAAGMAKLIGQTRVVRITAVRVKPGHQADFEALLKDMKAAGEKNPNTQPVLVSQAVEGYRGIVYYISTLRTSLAGFDNNPSMKDILGEEGYKKWLQVNADAVDDVNSSLYRVNAELSNPADDIAAAAPDFWHPKAASK